MLIISRNYRKNVAFFEIQFLNILSRTYRSTMKFGKGELDVIVCVYLIVRVEENEELNMFGGNFK